MKNILNDQLSISQQDDCQSRKDTNKVLTKTSDEQETTTHMGAITKMELTTEEHYTASINGVTSTCKFKITFSKQMIFFCLSHCWTMKGQASIHICITFTAGIQNVWMQI